eukprot:713310-Rhodomonas_salina.1
MGVLTKSLGDTAPEVTCPYAFPTRCPWYCFAYVLREHQYRPKLRYAMSSTDTRHSMGRDPMYSRSSSSSSSVISESNDKNGWEVPGQGASSKYPERAQPTLKP